MPNYIRSHVHWSQLDRARGEMVLLPTFRLPTLIHTRSGNAKWLYEISHTNPLWLHPEDAARVRVVTGDLLKVSTRIGHFLDKVWVTESVRPGVVACSHHLGRWRLQEDAARVSVVTGDLLKVSTRIGHFLDKVWVTESVRPGVVACSHHLGRWRLQESAGGERWSTALVDLARLEPGKWRMRQVHGPRPVASDDPDSSRIWWEEAGVHQNLTFPVQPDPVSGQHCWHQKVTVSRPGPDDRYGDVVVDTNRSFEVYREWLALARPAPGPDNLRRPLWLPRAFKPDASAYRLDG